MISNGNWGCGNTPEFEQQLTVLQIIREVKFVAERYGIIGDPLLPTNRASTPYDEELIRSIVTTVPHHIYLQTPSLVRMFARRIVLNHRRQSGE